MRHIVLYESGEFTVARNRPGVIITRLADGRSVWLQGDEAHDLEDDVDKAVLTITEEVAANAIVSGMLREYFTEEEEA